jgi:hypothetical protein
MDLRETGWEGVQWIDLAQDEPSGSGATELVIIHLNVVHVSVFTKIRQKPRAETVNLHHVYLL